MEISTPPTKAPMASKDENRPASSSLVRNFSRNNREISVKNGNTKTLKIGVKANTVNTGIFLNACSMTFLNSVENPVTPCLNGLGSFFPKYKNVESI